jgi:hypothetical protein
MYWSFSGYRQEKEEEKEKEEKKKRKEYEKKKKEEYEEEEGGEEEEEGVREEEGGGEGGGEERGGGGEGGGEPAGLADRCTVETHPEPAVAATAAQTVLYAAGLPPSRRHFRPGRVPFSRSVYEFLDFQCP